MTSRSAHRSGVLAQGPASTGENLEGIVVMFNTTTLPAGWVLCDGTNGTLDLRDKFVVGAGAVYTLGTVGGANTVVADLPLHSHNASDNGSGLHNHNTQNAAGSHNHTISVVQGEHGHNYAGTGNTTVFANQFANYLPVVGTTSTLTNTTATEAAHNTVASNAATSHSHGPTSNSGTHSHSASSNSAGSDSAHENRPPYYALVYAQATSTAVAEVGMIAMTESTTPTGWLTLNATNLPDLRDRFVVGSQSAYVLGATGGSNTVALTTTTMVQHSHNVSIGTENVGHQHTSNTQNHTHSANLSAHIAHSHTYLQQNSSTQTIGGTGSTIRATPGTANTLTGQSPAHSVTWASASDTHDHGALELTGGHAHTISGGNAGTGTAHENRPPYRATTFIRKTDTATTIPAGTIVMFNGTTIPSGWTEATNYRDRFPVGAGSTYAVGAVGGANAVTIDANTMPLHNHNASSNTDGNHSHLAASNNDASHSHTGSAAHNSAHSHGITVSGTTTTKLAGSYLALMSNSVTAATANSIHNHNATVSANNSSHTHSWPSTGNHFHNASMGNASSGTSHENRPPFAALTFIVKT